MKYLFFFLLTSLAAPVFAQDQEFGWLIGTWQQENKKSFEEWKYESGVLRAVGYTVDDKGARTVTEEIKLIKEGNDFFYVPDIAGPQGEIRFKIISFDAHSFVAFNPKHDFPQKIIYKRKDDSHLEASLQKGTHRVNFFFTKLK
jgi:hypothetical protein